MPDEPATESDGTERPHHNRRRFLKGVGAATVGAVAATGTASAQQYQFEGCRRVCSDTDADLAVVATGDGFECRPMTEDTDAGDVPWDWAGHCYEAGPDEVIVGALEESAWQGRQLFETWSCEFEHNPNACADEHYDSDQQVTAALDESESCGACSGTVVRGEGDGITATDAPPSSSDGDESPGSGGRDDAGENGQNGDGDGSAETDGDGEAGNDDGEEADGERMTSIAGALRTYIATQFGF